MNRRQVIAALGSALAWPVVAQAQPVGIAGDRVSRSRFARYEARCQRVRGTVQ
jgi:hypothetical protein